MLPGDARSLEYPSILLITPYVDKIINNDFGFALH